MVSTILNRRVTKLIFLIWNGVQGKIIYWTVITCYKYEELLTFNILFLVLGQLTPGQFHPRQFPPDNCLLDNCPPDSSNLGQLHPKQFPPTTISSRTIPPDSSHLGLLYCLRIITSQQLLSRAMVFTNYIFFNAIFCFFSMAQLYDF